MLRVLLRKTTVVRRLSTTSTAFSEPVDPFPPTGAQATPTIPPFVEKFEEPLAEKRARLVYQSRKRGIRENGLLLATFADKHLKSFGEVLLMVTFC